MGMSVNVTSFATAQKKSVSVTAFATSVTCFSTVLEMSVSVTDFPTVHRSGRADKGAACSLCHNNTARDTERAAWWGSPPRGSRPSSPSWSCLATLWKLLTTAPAGLSVARNSTASQQSLYRTAEEPAATSTLVSSEVGTGRGTDRGTGRTLTEHSLSILRQLAIRTIRTIRTMITIKTTRQTLTDKLSMAMTAGARWTASEAPAPTTQHRGPGHSWDTDLADSKVGRGRDIEIVSFKWKCKRKAFLVGCNDI